MTSAEMKKRLEREKELLIQLNLYLDKELTYIANQDIEPLEESMPDKYKLLRALASNREGIETFAPGDGPRHADEIRALQKDLAGLWKKASSLNELSKSMVTGRLTEIEQQLEPFFARDKGGYNRSGRKSRAMSRIVKTGA
ncbi:MAG: flagellar export chaperone FlgN [Deltaproteobacteria bacterium]|nr:flagellar export chaperone FlgN [Deltaproteobacteria bacterium]